MVKTNRCIIATVTILSGVASIFLLIALASEQWVTANGKFNINETVITLSTIKYGLYSGTFLPHPDDPTYEIKMTCLISENACAYLCGATSELRKNEMRRILNRENVTFNRTCPHIPTQASKYSKLIDNNIYYKSNDWYKLEFLNAGLYISTNVFLGIAILFGFFSTIFAIWIIIRNPSEITLSIYGLYTYNIVAFVSCLVTLILWAVLFSINITNNVGILYTIQKQMDTNMVNLGYSYWLILPSCVLYLISIVLVHVRQYPFSPELETTNLISD